MTDAARPAEGQLVAQRDAPVGGQAVLEGVMMRGPATWAVAVRRPDGDVDVRAFAVRSALVRHRALRLPVVRGVVALGESLALGFRALNLSANAQAGEDEQEITPLMWAGLVAAGLGLAIGLFFVVPVTLTSLFREQLGSPVAFWLVEGVVRTAIFLAYLALVSRLTHLRRVFEYHGAEHMAISCHEAGLPLTPAHAARFSRLHPRCGTSFLLIVMVVAVFVFAPIGLPAWWVLVLTRVLGVPLIAGLSFELIKAAGRNRRRRWVRALMWPGMQLQKMTTREPDAGQLAVAIAALEAVLAAGDEEPELVGAEVAA